MCTAGSGFTAGMQQNPTGMWAFWSALGIALVLCLIPFGIAAWAIHRDHTESKDWSSQAYVATKRVGHIGLGATESHYLVLFYFKTDGELSLQRSHLYVTEYEWDFWTAGSCIHVPTRIEVPCP